ncbi:MAG: hypothetical protein NTY19_08630 [Planctomycetota bacterium]|nr:hypothetical protein [Planctomycetota bacterium]
MNDGRSPAAVLEAGAEVRSLEWRESLLAILAATPVAGYLDGQQWATEPTALNALALLALDRSEAAFQATDRIADLQNGDGSVGAQPQTASPGWPTSLAVLAWLAAANAGRQYGEFVAKAIAWILSERGKTSPRVPEVGHDTMLAGWSWAQATHSWIEPTALYLVALKAAGHGQHVRAREAVQLLLDRQLPQGGCNYGNTVVMGNTLRPHVQPTGIALLGLLGEPTGGERVERALRYLEQTVNEATTTMSLCWALLGLTAHGRRPALADAWLERAFRRTAERDHSPYKYALIALATLGDKAPLITLARVS